MEEKQTKAGKEKRKWFQILAPKSYGGKILGETLGEEISKLKGRTLELSAGMAVGEVKKQFVSLVFYLTGEGNQGVETKVIGLKVSNSYLRRGMRRFKSKLEDSFLINCADGKVRIKILMLLRADLKRSVRSGLISASREICSKACEGKKFEDLVRFILSDSLSKQIKEGIRKIYPVAGIEIRYFCLD